MIKGRAKGAKGSVIKKTQRAGWQLKFGNKLCYYSPILGNQRERETEEDEAA